MYLVQHKPSHVNVTETGRTAPCIIHARVPVLRKKKRAVGKRGRVLQSRAGCCKERKSLSLSGIEPQIPGRPARS
jgi:hypothetical protein